MKKLRNREKAALLTPAEEQAVVGPILDGLDREGGEDTSLLLSEQPEFWEAVLRIKVAQHRKSWRLGVSEGRRRKMAGRVKASAFEAINAIVSLAMAMKIGKAIMGEERDPFIGGMV